MLRLIHGTSLKATSQEIQKRANVRPVVVLSCYETRLSWYGHIRRRDPEDITQQWYQTRTYIGVRDGGGVRLGQLTPPPRNSGSYDIYSGKKQHICLTNCVTERNK